MVPIEITDDWFVIKTALSPLLETIVTGALMDVPGAVAWSPDRDVSSAVDIEIRRHRNITGETKLFIPLRTVGTVDDVPGAIAWSPHGHVCLVVPIVVAGNYHVAIQAP